MHSNVRLEFSVGAQSSEESEKYPSIRCQALQIKMPIPTAAAGEGEQTNKGFFS